MAKATKTIKDGKTVGYVLPGGAVVRGGKGKDGRWATIVIGANREPPDTSPTYQGDLPCLGVPGGYWPGGAAGGTTCIHPPGHSLTYG